MTCVGSGRGVGLDPVGAVVAEYRHDDPLIRFRPRLQLRGLEECMFLPVVNLSLAEKLHSVAVFANGYKLADIGPGDFYIDTSAWGGGLPGEFTPDELRDEWVIIRPKAFASSFHLRFTARPPAASSRTPRCRTSPRPAPASAEPSKASARSRLGKHAREELKSPQSEPENPPPDKVDNERIAEPSALTRQASA